MSTPQDPILIHQNKKKRKRRGKRDAIPPTNKEEEIINNPKTDVFLAIAQHLSPIIPNGSNFAFSPLSLRTLLSLIAAGTSGPTLQQLLSFLKADSIDEVNAQSSELVSSVLTDVGVLKLSFANALWIKKGFNLKHSFRQVVDNVYKASSYQADFAEGNKIVSEVNSWVEKQTNGLIKDIMPRGSVRELTRIILANALYFKGKWLEENYFRKSNTKEDEFNLLGGDSVKVPFMRSYLSEQYIGVFDGFKVARLLYKQEKRDKRQFSMYILLPDANDGLPALMEKIVSEPDFLDRHLPDKTVAVNKFRLPRFKISYRFGASKALEHFGLSLPFKAGGLTEMADSIEEGKELFVSEILNKSFIEVNEEGTEAASVGLAAVKKGCSRYNYRPPKVDFVADHPFIFMLREDTTAAMLFFGHVLNPLNK